MTFDCKCGCAWCEYRSRWITAAGRNPEFVDPTVHEICCPTLVRANVDREDSANRPRVCNGMLSRAIPVSAVVPSHGIKLQHPVIPDVHQRRDDVARRCGCDIVARSIG